MDDRKRPEPRFLAVGRVVRQAVLARRGSLGLRLSVTIMLVGCAGSSTQQPPATTASFRPSPSTTTGVGPSASLPRATPFRPSQSFAPEVAALQALLPKSIAGALAQLDGIDGARLEASGGGDACPILCPGAFVKYAGNLGVPADSLTVAIATYSGSEDTVAVIAIRSSARALNGQRAWLKTISATSPSVSSERVEIGGRPEVVVLDDYTTADLWRVAYLHERGDVLYIVVSSPPPRSPDQPPAGVIEALGALQ